jgi:hypothetical protein
MPRPFRAPRKAGRTSDDGLVYTFRLRPNLKWSNGEPVVAEDFAAGLRRLVNPATASQYAQVVDVIANAADIVTGKKPVDSLGVAAPDDATVVITLATPAPYLPGPHGASLPARRCIDPRSRSSATDSRAPESRCPMAPSCSTEWLQGSSIRTVRNKHYWNDAANRIDAVKFLQIADENAELRAYRAGELHLTAVVPAGSSTGSARISARTCTSRRNSRLTTTDSTWIGLCSGTCACAGAVDGHRSRTTRELGACAWANCRPTAGCRPESSTTARRSFDYEHTPIAVRIAEAQIAAGRRGVHARQTAELRAALQQWRGPYQGRRGGGFDVERSSRVWTRASPASNSNR